MGMRFSFLLVLMLAACTSNEKDSDANVAPQPFNISLDMSQEEVRTLYADCEFIPGSAGNHGLCGGGETTYDVLRNDTLLFYFWNNYEENQLGGFILFDPKQSFRGVYVGMTVREVLKLFPKAEGTISLIDSSESLYTEQDYNCWFKLNSTENDYAAEYEWRDGEHQFVKFIDLDKKIEAIFVKGE